MSTSGFMRVWWSCGAVPGWRVRQACGTKASVGCDMSAPAPSPPGFSLTCRAELPARTGPAGSSVYQCAGPGVLSGPLPKSFGGCGVEPGPPAPGSTPQRLQETGLSRVSAKCQAGREGHVADCYLREPESRGTQAFGRPTRLPAAPDASFGQAAKVPPPASFTASARGVWLGHPTSSLVHWPNRTTPRSATSAVGFLQTARYTNMSSSAAAASPTVNGSGPCRSARAEPSTCVESCGLCAAATDGAEVNTTAPRTAALAKIRAIRFMFPSLPWEVCPGNRAQEFTSPTAEGFHRSTGAPPLHVVVKVQWQMVRLFCRKSPGMSDGGRRARYSTGSSSACRTAFSAAISTSCRGCSVASACAVTAAWKVSAALPALHRH